MGQACFLCVKPWYQYFLSGITEEIQLLLQFLQTGKQKQGCPPRSQDQIGGSGLSFRSFLLRPETWPLITFSFFPKSLCYSEPSKLVCSSFCNKWLFLHELWPWGLGGWRIYVACGIDTPRANLPLWDRSLNTGAELFCSEEALFQVLPLILCFSYQQPWASHREVTVLLNISRCCPRVEHQTVQGGNNSTRMPQASASGCQVVEVQ